MCGIIGAVAQRDVTPILLEGLRRLEYRGYDSAGIAVVDQQHQLHHLKVQGKVSVLNDAIQSAKNNSFNSIKITGVAHTRWATHGEPIKKNAHPHLCQDSEIALVHNGIIENYSELKKLLRDQGYQFVSETDSEVIVHALHANRQHHQASMLKGLQQTLSSLSGSYALAIISSKEPSSMLVACHGSPLVIGLGIEENFVASDVLALLPVTQRFIFLQDGDIAQITPFNIEIFDLHGNPCQREEKISTLRIDAVEKGGYRHYMLKEIYEQPRAIADTLEGRLDNQGFSATCLGPDAEKMLKQVNNVQIVACGTSFHAGLVAKHWFESVAGLACQVEVASEFRYRNHIVPEKTLFVCISQSGETADTLSALKLAKQLGFFQTLCICNAPESSMVRLADWVLLTHAGPEIGVASTKAFTTQLIALFILVSLLGKYHGFNIDTEKKLISSLYDLPRLLEKILQLDKQIQVLAERFGDKQHCLFLGRGDQYPIAMEGALKLKEISYIHAEAYPAGELKHGPIALIDNEMPVIAVAPDNQLVEKLKSNLEEVRARGGELIVFADEAVNIQENENTFVIKLPSVQDIVAPIVFSIPLQLLAYHVAVLKGTDVDQPRNLAKSVTVE